MYVCVKKKKVKRFEWSSLKCQHLLNSYKISVNLLVLIVEEINIRN